MKPTGYDCSSIHNFRTRVMCAGRLIYRQSHHRWSSCSSSGQADMQEDQCWCSKEGGVLLLLDHPLSPQFLMLLSTNTDLFQLPMESLGHHFQKTCNRKFS